MSAATPGTGAMLPCGPNADDRYCANYWELSAENKRLRMLIGELLDTTGLDDTERAEWLDRSRLSESAVYPDDDRDPAEDDEASYRAHRAAEADL